MRSQMYYFLAILLLVILVGCSENQITPICKYLTSENSLNKCIYNVAVDKGDISICDGMSSKANPSGKDIEDCYQAVAIANNDQELCKQIKLDEQDIRYCLSEIAKKTKDSSICYEIESFGRENSYTTSKYGCLISLAKIKSDVSLCVLTENSNCFIDIAKQSNSSQYCDMINDISQKKICYNQLNPNYYSLYPIEAYQKLNTYLCGNGTFKWNCISDIAIKLNNTDMCDLINISSIKAHCIDVIISRLEDWDKCSSIDSIIQSKRCYQHIIEIKQDVSLEDCFKYEHNFEKENCFLRNAKASLNVSYCHWLFDKQKSKECYLFVANQTQDVSICDNIGSYTEKVDCYRNIVKNEKDIAFCDEINEDRLKQWCYGQTAILTDDIAICNNLINISKYKNQCYRYFAVNKTDFSLCNLIDDNNEKEMCFAQYGFSVNDSSFCEQISTEKIADSCFKYIAVSNNDNKLCKQIMNPETEAICSKEIAVNQSNPKLCKEMEDVFRIEIYSKSQKTYSIKDECYYDVALKLGNIDTCKNINAPNTRYACEQATEKKLEKSIKDKDQKLYSDAIKNSNEQVCLSIADNMLQSNCIRTIAINKKDGLLCKQIENSIEKGLCLRDVGIANNNSKTCKEIVNKADKEMCLREIAITSNNINECQDLSGINKDICIWNFALEDKESIQCNDIENEYLKTNCIINIAVKNNDENICFTLNENDKNICLSNYANYHAENLQYCNIITDNETRNKCYIAVSDKIETDHTIEFCSIGIDQYYDWCLRELSKKTKESYPCSLIIDEDQKMYCYENLLRQGIDTTVCNEIIGFSNSYDFSSYEECYEYGLYVSSLKNNDISYCQKMPVTNQRYKDSCFMNIAYESSNPVLCSEIDNALERDDCYSYFCIKNEDMLLCENIEDKNFRDWSNTIIAIKNGNDSLCNNVDDEYYMQQCKKIIDD